MTTALYMLAVVALSAVLWALLLWLEWRRLLTAAGAITPAGRHAVPGRY